MRNCIALDRFEFPYNLLMARRKRALSRLMVSEEEILAAALVGLEHQRSQVDEKMAELLRQIDGLAAPAPKKHTISAAGRRRIAAVQRRR